MRKAVTPVQRAAAVPSPEKQIAEQLTAQYREAVSGTKAILVFGCMMMQLPAVLNLQESRGPQTKGHGLKGWIESNCPDVNYETARAFLRLARGLYDTLSLPQSLDLARLLTAPAGTLKGKEAKLRQDIEAALSGKSARQLEFDFGIRRLPGKVGAPEGNANALKANKSLAEMKEEAFQNMSQEYSKAMTVLNRIFSAKKHLLFNTQQRRMLADELRSLYEQMRDSIKLTPEEIAALKNAK